MSGLLERLDGEGSSKTFVLTGPGPIVLGRGKASTIHIDDSKLSREHCVFVLLDGRWQIKDLGSTNGTKVNDQSVTTAVLSDGDVITMGRVSLRFHVKPSSGQSDATTQDFVAAKGRGARVPGIESSKQADASAQRTGELPRMPVQTAPGQQRRLLGGRYEVGEVIHQGSSGMFVKARDAKSERVVCIKLLAKRVAEDDADLRRFMRGVQTAAKLQHPNIVQLFRGGKSTASEQWWLAMEFVDGPSLRQVIAKYGIGKMLAPAKVLSIARDITAALEVAYEKQVLHRNIRPENILLTKSGTAKLSDFTLTRGVVLTTLQRITGSNELVGDLAYMAPERTDPDGMIDCRSDLYALGACLYTLLAGRSPFTGRGTVDLIQRIRHDSPLPPGRFNLSVPGPLEGVVMKCLSKSPTDRFQSPMELREELARVARFQGMWSAP
jgi:hypothetical protein